MIGILDKDGVNLNPLTNNPYSDEYKKLANIWSKFPAYEDAENIINTIKNNQVTLVISGTGSGKTVLIPKYVLHVLDYKGKVAVTLPKQVITKSSAEFAAKTLDVELGKQVGYKYKGSPKNAKSNKTKLLYATDGTIVAKLLNDQTLKDFDAVVIDEAHERKVQIDFLLYLLKETIKLRPEFKLIIMSATINSEIFKNYYVGSSFAEVNIGGKTNYPITSIFLNKAIDYNLVLEKGFDILVELLNKPLIKNEANDIIFFVTSANEALMLCEKLNEYQKNNKCTLCIEMFSGIKPEKQELAQDKELYKKDSEYNRKVVIATNVAESSLTIDGIKYVIDSGYEFKSSYDPICRARKLDRQLITIAQVKQRMGRSGRTEPGICYHLYTEDQYKNMESFPKPDIMTSNIVGECLGLMNIDIIQSVDNLRDVLSKFIEVPDKLYINDAIELLRQSKCIENGTITSLGSLANKLHNDPMSGIAFIYGYMYNCAYEVINIIGVIDTIKQNMNELFINDDKMRYKIMKSKEKFKHKYGDHLAILKIYDKFNKQYENNKGHEWCYKNMLNFNILKKSKDTIIQLTKNAIPILKEAGNFIVVNDKINNLSIEKKILTCLCLAYRQNIGRLSNKYYHTNSCGDMSITLDRNSYVYEKKPKRVLFHELFISMGNPKLNIVSKITTSIYSLILESS